MLQISNASVVVQYNELILPVWSNLSRDQMHVWEMQIAPQCEILILTKMLML